jgi:hypothetical protein
MSNSIIGWPWYVKLPGMVAGFFVSAFSSKLPDGLQSLGLWVGIGFGVRVAQTRHLTTRVSGDFLLLREVQLAVEPKTDAAFRMSGQSCSAPLHRFLSVIQCRSNKRPENNRSYRIRDQLPDNNRARFLPPHLGGNRGSRL